MPIYIDADWNKVYIYKDNKKIGEEQCLILYDLISKKIDGIGEECTELRKIEKQYLAVNFSENRRINDAKSFEIFMDYLIKKNAWNDEIFFVNRYHDAPVLKNKTFKYISEEAFISMFCEKEIYLDFRSCETIIFNKLERSIKVIPTGEQKVLNFINRYFYLNFNATLNTSKSMLLLNRLINNDKINFVTCRSYDSNKDVDIKIDNKQNLLREIKIYLDDVKKHLPPKTIVQNSKKMQEIIDCVN